MVAPPSALTTAPLAPSGAGVPAPRTLLPLARLLPALAALTSQLLASFLAALVLLFKSGDAAAAGGTAVVSLRMECSVETTDDDDAPLPTRHAVVSATKRFRLRPAAGSAPALDAPTKPGAIALRAIVLHAPKTATARPCAFLTLLTRDSYLPGVQALARSLHAVGTRHPLLVMHTGALTPEAAAALAREPGCHLVQVQHYQPEGSHDPTRYKLAAYGECWCKLQMWGLEEYGRLAYLDADMVVRRNIDALFSLPEGFYAVPDCAFGRASAAERDACSYFTPHVPHYFNAGFFLMRPSAAELRRFRALLAAGAVEIGAFAEQDFLNQVYRGSWRPLPLLFNAQKGVACHHPELWAAAAGRLAVIHYTDAKPWVRDHPDHQLPPYKPLVELWWSAFNSAGFATGPPLTPAELAAPGSETAAAAKACCSGAKAV